MIIASIDIGSNTVILLIAEINLIEKKLNPLANYYQIPRISKGLKPGFPIIDNKIEELLKILAEFKQICITYNVEQVMPVATNAFRLAVNSHQIISEIKNNLGWDVQVIDGETEAKLTFLGSVFPISDQFKIVIDIGGGSTEIICGNNSVINFKKSFSIGIVSLSENILTNRFVELSVIIDAEEKVKQTIGKLSNYIQNSAEAIAVAGTPTTLSCIKQNIKFYDEVKVDGSNLTYDEICNIMDDIQFLSPELMIEKYGQVVEGREDILLAGCIILKVVMQELKLHEIKVSCKGLRHGIIIDYMLNQRYQ